MLQVASPSAELGSTSVTPQESIKKLLANSARRVLRNVGAFSLAASSKRRRESLLILCYHGLSMDDEHRWLPQLYITPQQFRERLAFLKRMQASVLPLNEALQRLKSGDLPPRSVTITFDDGFCDFAQHGVPALTDFGYSCTLYLTTHYCNYRLPIITLVLDYLLWRSGRMALALPEQEVVEVLPIRNFAERQVLVQRILHWMEQRQLTTAEKDQVARGIAHRLGIDYDPILDRRMLQIMSPGEIRQAANAGIDIQLHTHRHRTPRDRSLFTQEIEENRRRIEELTGKTPVHFCYPSGDYSPEFFAWLADCGVESATTCDSGLAQPTSSALKLPRVLDHSHWDALRFESAVSGLLV
jgi:peptidoglycan/xylan/chitin deacetylase (PgdA/CDA1 family)